MQEMSDEQKNIAIGIFLHCHFVCGFFTLIGPSSTHQKRATRAKIEKYGRASESRVEWRWCMDGRCVYVKSAVRKKMTAINHSC
jgi:hypothetical protein